ncbi:MAG: hypothetical protein IPG00_22335 [Saprospiraceae bacterium]|nr:hypothetical protein [Saprospiraceae bacterium]
MALPLDGNIVVNTQKGRAFIIEMVSKAKNQVRDNFPIWVFFIHDPPNDDQWTCPEYIPVVFGRYVIGAKPHKYHK